MSKKILYSIVATDINYNNSLPSKPIEVKRPDTIAPVPSIIKELSVQQKGIQLSWIPSSSEDVKQCVLYHKEINKKEFTEIKKWSVVDTIRSFLDTSLQLGVGYNFKIVCYDENNNLSTSNIPYVKFETGFRKKIAEITSQVDRTEKTIFISWNYTEQDVEKIIIYRAKQKEPLTLLKTIPSPQNTFTDKSLNIGNTYEYRLKAVFKNGAESIISDGIWVEY